jgi:hypothetical protein
MFLFTIFSISQVFARPVSYSGGTTIMQNNNTNYNSLHIHYSSTYKYSIGYKGEYFREPRVNTNTVQLNYLAKRINKKESQENFYIKSGIGNFHLDTNNDLFDYEGTNGLGGFVGFATDWEDRRYFISYENRYYASDNKIMNEFMQRGRVGIAPYVVNYGNWHTWLMLDIMNTPEQEDNVVITPMFRFFKGTHMFEIGISDDKQAMFNFALRF